VYCFAPGVYCFADEPSNAGEEYWLAELISRLKQDRHAGQ